VVLAVVLAAGIAVLALSRASGKSDDDASSSGAVAPPLPSGSSAATSESGTTPAGTTQPSAGPLPASGGDVTSCIVSLFPPDSFDHATDFSALCSETDPFKTGAGIRRELVRGHRTVSDGMREWALLGWYEIPAASLVRSRCCPSPEPLEFPETKACKPMAEVLAPLDHATAATSDPADQTLRDAVDAYTRDVYCIVRSGIAHRFGRKDKPEGGEITAFTHFLGRFLKVKR
jgi:eukaryotic-like serine/threonine-protein kinase